MNRLPCCSMRLGGDGDVSDDRYVLSLLPFIGAIKIEKIEKVSFYLPGIILLSLYGKYVKKEYYINNDGFVNNFLIVHLFSIFYTYVTLCFVNINAI